MRPHLHTFAAAALGFVPGSFEEIKRIPEDHFADLEGYIPYGQKPGAKDYRGRIGLKDLKRRLKHWQGRVAAVKAMTADAVGPAKGKATKLINSGEKLLATIREEIAHREAA